MMIEFRTFEFIEMLANKLVPSRKPTYPTKHEKENHQLK